MKVLVVKYGLCGGIKRTMGLAAGLPASGVARCDARKAAAVTAMGVRR